MSARASAPEKLSNVGGGGVRYFAKIGSPRQPAVVLPNASWHLRYFMSARAIHIALCAHSDASAMVDALEWWRHDVNASALCEDPGRLHRAIHSCGDLWGRHEPRDGPLRLTPAEESVEDMPRRVAEQPEAFTMHKLNRLQELAGG